MPAETTRARNPAGHAGVFNNLLALVNDFAAFVESRFALFAKESKLALMQLLLLGACLVAALMFFALGYLFLLGSAVVGIAHLTHISWIRIALGAAGVHFLLALICVLIAWFKAVKLPYRELSSEFRKDREWLKNLDQTSRPNR
jgi:Putative Actinobacterial Holin-X, holin superfamily III